MPFPVAAAVAAGATLAGQGMGMANAAARNKKQFKYQQKIMDKSLEQNKALALFNQEQQMKMWEATGPEGQMRELKEAGLNPGLIYGMGGAGGQTAQAAQAQGQGTPTAPTQESGAEMGIMGLQLASQLNLTKAQTDKIKAETANITGQTGLQGLTGANIEASTGKGVLGSKRKGGHVTIKVDEPSYIMGIISLTPRVDYSQGNQWDLNLVSMDDLHKPALDEIGFQELITEQMAWFDTQWNPDGGTGWTQRSAGKQPAWLNYMTNVNVTKGNFAIPDNEMFMTLNRRYEADLTDANNVRIADLTTYIDPSKFNFIFAETQLDAQNFWAQIAIDIVCRRKMSAKVMPNL